MTLSKLQSENAYWFTITCVALITLVAIAAFVPYGILRLTYDSYDLMAASESFQTYLTGHNKDGYSYLERAPLHPVLLSFFEDKVVAFWWINLGSLFMCCTLIYKIARTNYLARHWAAAAVAIIMFCYPWLMNFQFLWTEPIFIVLILLLCYAQLREWHPLSIVGICVLLFLTRKAGIFFFASAALCYLIEKKHAKGILTLTAGVVVFGLWQWLEFLHSSTGYVGAMISSLEQYDRIFYIDAMTSWFLPIQIPLIVRISLVSLFFLTTISFFRSEIFFVLRQRQNVVLLSMAGAYTIILISFSGVTGYEDAERYLNVVYPLWAILAMSAVAKIVATCSKTSRILLQATVAIWLMYPFLRTAHHLF